MSAAPESAVRTRSAAPSEARARADVPRAHEALDRLSVLVRDGATITRRDDQIGACIDEVVIVVRTALQLLDELARDPRVAASCDERLEAARNAMADAVAEAASGET